MEKTADELAYERYQRGEYTYDDYIAVCIQEDVEPIGWKEHAREVLTAETEPLDNTEVIEEFIAEYWQNLDTDENNLERFDYFNYSVKFSPELCLSITDLRHATAV